MTYTEFSQNKAARQHLQKLLQDPVLSQVLDMLRDANLPKVIMQIPGAPADLDPIQAIAISATSRAGFQHAISLLRSLPAMEPAADLQRLAQQPWEWTANEEPAKTPKRRKQTV